MTVECTSRVQVRWGDVDAAGIVFYPRFFEWYDLGCEALFASLGFPWPETFPRYGIVGVPIVESGSRFPSPARYGDALAIRAMVAWVKDKTFRMEYEISVERPALRDGLRGARLGEAGRPRRPASAGRAHPGRGARVGCGASRPEGRAPGARVDGPGSSARIRHHF